MNDYKLNRQGGVLCKDYHCFYNEGNGICEYGGCKDIKIQTEVEEKSK